MDRLVEDYLRCRDPQLLEQVVTRHERLARALAGRFARSGESLDDLTQQAMLGLLKAVERYDPDQGVRFSTFAWHTISGELKRYLRDRSWRVRVPRRLHDRHLHALGAVDDLRAELGREPTEAELATRCQTSPDEVRLALGVGAARRPGSLDAPGATSSWASALDRLGQDDGGFDQVEARHLVHQLLARLPRRDRHILVLRYLFGLSQHEIATRVGISPVHVSRLLARSLEELRTRQVPVAA